MARLNAGSISVAYWGLLFQLLLSGGCVEQLLTVDASPGDGVVTLNGQEAGRTPVTTTFTWYGYYDVNIRKDGYQTLKTKSPVIAPWWQWMPFDLVAAILPIHFTDQHFLTYTLQPITERLNDPQRLVRQGERLRADLETGANEPRSRGAKASSQPSTTRPATKVSKPQSIPSTQTSVLSTSDIAAPTSGPVTNAPAIP